MVEIKKPVMIKGKRYEEGDIFKPRKNDMPLVIRLNERGFIKPLSKEELLELSNSFIVAEKHKKTVKKEEKINE